MNIQFGTDLVHLILGENRWAAHLELGTGDETNEHGSSSACATSDLVRGISVT